MLKDRNICTEYFSHLNSAYTNDEVYRGIKQEDKCQIPCIRVSTAEYFLYLRLNGPVKPLFELLSFYELKIVFGYFLSLSIENKNRLLLPVSKSV